MNARTSRRMTGWWEWLVAGGLSLASCATLILLLLTLARTQAREALQATRQEAGRLGIGVGRIGARESGRSTWQAIGGPSYPYSRREQGQAGAADGSVWSNLRYETTVVSTADSGGGSNASNARTTVITVSVVLVWLLGLRLVAGPLRPAHHIRRGGRWSRSY